MKKLLLSTIFTFTAFTMQAETFQVDFSNSNIVVTRPEEISASVSTGPGVFYNSYYKHSWIMHYNGMSYIEVSFTNNLPEGETATLDLIHLSSLVGKTFYSPVTISLNGSEVISGFAPPSCNYRSDSFDITPYVKTGKNKLRITLDNDAVCNYWIQKLEVNFQ